MEVVEAVKESCGGGGVWPLLSTDCPVTGRPGLGVDTDNTRLSQPWDWDGTDNLLGSHHLQVRQEVKREPTSGWETFQILTLLDLV